MASFQLEDWNPLYAEGDNREETRLIGIEFEGKPKPQEVLNSANYPFVGEEWLDEEQIAVEVSDDEYSDPEDWVDWRERGAYIKDKLNEQGVEVAGVGYDGGGKEFVTFPDSISHFKKGGSERLKNVVEFLSETTEPDYMSGTHIHVSKLNSDTQTTWNNIYWFEMCFAPQLQKIFGRVTHWARTPLPEGYFSQVNNRDEVLFQAPLKRPEPATNQVYNKGSMVVDRGNRYEFRGPKATHDLDEILAWAELCNNIVEMCANGYIKNMTFSEVLKGKYIRKYVDKIGKNNEARKITPEERAKSIADVGYVQININENKVL